MASPGASSRAAKLPEVLGDVVRFLFFSAWRVGEVRTLEWRDYDRAEGVIRLRPERSKNRHGRVLPVDQGELAAILERRWKARRLDCPYLFHLGDAGALLPFSVAARSQSR